MAGLNVAADTICVADSDRQPLPDMGEKGTNMRDTTGLPVGRRAGIKGATKPLDTEVAVPEPPASLDATGRAYWAYLWMSITTITPADTLVVTQLCEALQEKEHLSEQVALGVVPRFYRIKQGTILAHPILAAIQQQRVLVNGLLSVLGLTPTDRAKLGALEDGVSALLEEIKATRNSRAERREARSE